MEKIFIAGDHAGYALKKLLIEMNPELPWQDLGPTNEASVDYPDYADKLAQEMKAAVTKGFHPVGVLVCGSGQGMAIRANRFSHLRAALCWTPEIAEWARSHNNANVLCLGSRHTDSQTAQQILKTFLNTEFEGGRHERRVAKLSENC